VFTACGGAGGEAQLLRIAVDAMHTCGLAMAIQGLATGLLGAQQPALQQSGSLQAVSGVHTKKKKIFTRSLPRARWMRASRM